MSYLDDAKQIFQLVSSLKTRRKTAKQAMKEWLVVITLGTLAVIFRAAEKAGLIDLISTAWIERNPFLFVTIGCLITYFIGLWLNIFKKKNQQLYGFTEVIFSLFLSGSIVYRNIDSVTANLPAAEMINLIIPFLPAIYFTQRGINNYVDGRDKIKKEEKEIARIHEIVLTQLDECKTNLAHRI